MKPWKKLEEFCSQYLGWKRLTKQHYGHSQHDIEGNGFKGDCKHYKKHRIHSIKQKADMLYKDDIILFTKVKGTHYDPRNVLVTIRLDWFKKFLEDYKKVLNLDIDNKDVKSVDNMLTNNLENLKYYLDSVNLLTNKMKKILKELEEK